MKPREIILIIFISSIVLLSCSRGGSSRENTSYCYPSFRHSWGVVRATPLKLKLFVGNKTKFNDPQGIACTRLDVWDNPDKEGDDDEITAYGVNSGDNCIIYNTSMFSLGIYGIEKNHQKFKYPWGIAANSRGDVYVADRGNARVVRLYNPGKELRFVESLGTAGVDTGQFIDPRGVAIDANYRLYVTDAGVGRITVFNDSGKVLQIWDDFIEPDGIAVVSSGQEWSFARRDSFVVVIDSMHQRVQKFSLDGKLLGVTRASDWGVTNAYLGFVTLDYYNQAVITDRNNHCIHKLDHDLKYLTSFGKKGSGDYEFDEPRGIAIYRRFGQLLVAERLGAQYLWVAVDIPEIEAHIDVDSLAIKDSILYNLSINFTTTEAAFVALDIHDGVGRFITRLTHKRHRFNAGDNTYTWWGLRIRPQHPSEETPPTPMEYPAGSSLPPGDYTIRGYFRATYSSREHFEVTKSVAFKVKER